MATIIGSEGDDDGVSLPALDGTPDADEIQGLGGDDLIRGFGSNDLLIGGDGNDTILGGDGMEYVDGGDGDDSIELGRGGAGFGAVASGGAGDDVIRHEVSGYNANGGYRLYGGTGNDTIVSSWFGLTEPGSPPVPDFLYGGDGDDSLVGNALNEIIDAGSGNDSVMAGDGQDTITSLSGIAVIDGGAGAADVLVLDRRDAAADLSYIDAAGDEVWATIDGDGTVVRGVEGYDIWLGNGDDTIGGGSFQCTIRGHEGDDSLFGQSSDWYAWILGGLGNDTIIGTATGDVLYGEDGNDVIHTGATATAYLIYSDAAYAGAGNDSIYAAADLTLSSFFFGGDGDDLLQTAQGDDNLDSGFGADTMIGGRGNDNHLVTEIGDVIVEAPGEGIDTVHSLIDYTLADHLEHLLLGSTLFFYFVFGGGAYLNAPSFLHGVGNALDNRMTLTFSHTGWLEGLGGNDTLAAGGGSATLDGGAGDDSLVGGVANDRFIVDSGNDVVVNAADGGIDTVESSVSWTLADHTEHLVLTGTARLKGTGNALANAITGNAGSNNLSGKDGNDALSGGGGNDTLIGGKGSDLLTGGDGDDVFGYAKRTEGGDTIADFGVGDDRIVVSASGFGGGLAAGMDLGATGRFVAHSSSGATVGVGQFIFNTATHELFWDANGTATGQRTLLVTLSTGAVAANDILIIA